MWGAKERVGYEEDLEKKLKGKRLASEEENSVPH